MQASRWVEITVQSRGTHAGTTTLDSRQDAMLFALKPIVYSGSAAKNHDTVFMTDTLIFHPASTDKIVDRVTVT